MASTVPVKSQPLHNFALPHLKWKNNHPRGRSSSSSSSPHHHQSQSQSQSQSPSRSQSQSPMRESPMREPPRHSPLRSGGGGGGDGVLEREGLVKSKTTVEYKRHPRNSLKIGVHASDHDRVLEKSEKKSSSEPDHINNIINSNINNNNNSNKESRSRFLIKIQTGAAAARKSSNKGAEEGNQEERKGEEEDEEPMGKTWNLRPRKPIHKSLNVSGGGAGGAGSGSAVQEKRAQSELPQVNLDSGNRNRLEGEASGAEKKEKRVRFSIPLSREDIEEDIFVITGSKPARRPKKRAKIVQKQLDTLFPGLWLASITPDSYKVSENPTKG